MTIQAAVLDFQEIDRTQAGTVGGKGAHLGELSRIRGVRVPAGFCITTEALARIMAEASPTIDDLIEELSRLRIDEREAIAALSARVRRAIEAVTVPDDLATEIGAALARLDEDGAYAVRSSATAEDGPTASFAGQQDSYLNVVGTAAVLEHVSRCWASLFTERAVTYRLRAGQDLRQARMAVVVQRMAPAQAAGVMFTADPVSGDRKLVWVEACLGLGEALVSGLVNADVYKVRGGAVVASVLGTKELAIRAVPGGGVRQEATAPELGGRPALSQQQAVRLAELGRRIEVHFGRPQDIEWCLAGDGFQIVQSRPITTLFPVPGPDDGENRVYVSVGHQQMMTDAIRPLGLSLFRLIAPAMQEAGGRLFMEFTQSLASPARGAALLEAMGKHDPLMRDAMQAVIDRGFVPTIADDAAAPPPAALDPLEADPAIPAELIAANQASIATLKREIAGKSGAELIEFILADIPELKRILFDPQSHRVFMTAIDATWWLNEHLEDWLGEKNVADVLTQSAPGNVTSEMGLALLDVADAIRPHAQVVALLEQARDDDFLGALDTVAGGRQARAAIEAWLDRYGMRCVGEIDITRPRWSEQPSALVPILLGNVRNFAPGEAARRFEQGLRQAAAKQAEVLERLRALPDGEAKAEETRRMIDRVRTFIGYREYPKYGKISRFFVYKQALMAEAGRLARAGAIEEAEDIFYLSLQELLETARSGRADAQLIAERKQAFAWQQTLTPPRVLTSDGECVAGAYRREDLPAGALVGLAVSAGTVEGRARVILDMAQADLRPGDILVTAFTDPSWTPLFVVVAGLVTEVGGMMTHGAVIAREYGLPAIVGVENATRRIRDGQRIRVHGGEGYVELLD